MQNHGRMELTLKGVGIYMFNREKSVKLANVVLATTLVTSVVAVTNPADANSQKDFGKERKAREKNVKKANKKPFTLSLMHTNDTHAHLDNMAKRVTAVKEVRAEKPEAFLIDAGDVFSGTLYFNEFQGQADLEFMNLMKYDAMTFGNHEFDLGSSRRRS